MLPRFAEDTVMRVLLGLSDGAIDALKYKIGSTYINYRRDNILRILLATCWAVLSSRPRWRRKDIHEGAALLCLEQVHYRDGRRSANVKALFAEEPGAQLYNLDLGQDLTVIEGLQAVASVLAALCLFLLLSKPSRDLLSRVLLKKTRAWISSRAILSQHPRKVILVGMGYDLRRFFLAFWLRERQSIPSAPYISRPFLSAHDSVIADEIILGNRWAFEAFQKMAAKLVFNRITYLHNKNYPTIAKRSARNAEFRKNRVAFYMSGAYVRGELSFSTKEFQLDEVRRESLVLDLLRRYAMQYPQLTFVIFPHPSVETEASAREHYRQLLELPNVSIRPPGKSSAELYDEFEIGVSSGSNTVFERLEAGHKGLFVYPIQPLLAYAESSLAPIILRDPVVEPSRIDHFRTIDHIAFFNVAGGDPGGEPTSAAGVRPRGDGRR